VAVADYKIVYLDPTDWNQWDRFVGQTPQGSIFQTSAYINCVKKAFERPAEIVTVFRRNRLVGGVVLYPQKHFGLPYVGTPFFVPRNGFILDEFKESFFYYKRINSRNKVLELLLKEIESRFVFCALQQSSEEDLRQLMWKNWQFIPDYTVVVYLQQNKDIFQQMDKDVRRRIRIFEKTGFKFEQLKQLNPVYKLLEESYGRHGLNPPIARSHFIEFSQSLLNSNLGKCFAVNQGGEISAFALVVENFPAVYGLFSGRNFIKAYSNAELYLQWRIIQEYQANGYKIFDMLGGMVPSIAKVKLELGGRLVRRDNVRYFRNRFYEFLFDIEASRKRKKRSL